MQRHIALLTFVLLSNHAWSGLAQNCAGAYGQCGGKVHTGPTCCNAGWYCFRQDEWYSQCRPNPTDSNCPLNVFWSKCGGDSSFNGPTCCPAGSQCIYFNPYYSQCIPNESVSTAQTSPTSTQTFTNAQTTQSTQSTQPTQQGSTSTRSTGMTTQSQSSTTSSTDPNGQPVYQNVLATEHMADEVGSCELPKADYAVNYPVALGTVDALASYKWRPELCGHILTVNCGNGPLDIIITNSNIGGGLDLYKSTWEKATNNLPPGQTKCSVQLSSRDTLTTPGYQCYYNDGLQDYYRNVALLNTGSRIVVSAKMNGAISGAHRGGNPYFAFDGFSPVDNTNITFTFEDGGTYQVNLRDCGSAEYSNKQRWK